MVTPQELDRAVASGVAELTRPNARPVRCANTACRRSCGYGQARQLWIDGHRRGFLCTVCQWDEALERWRQRPVQLIARNVPFPRVLR